MRVVSGLEQQSDGQGIRSAIASVLLAHSPARSLHIFRWKMFL